MLRKTLAGLGLTVGSLAYGLVGSFALGSGAFQFIALSSSVFVGWSFLFRNFFKKTS